MPPKKSDPNSIFDQVYKDVKKSRADPIGQMRAVLKHCDKLCSDNNLKYYKSPNDIEKLKIDNDLLYVLNVFIGHFVKRYGKEDVDRAVEGCNATGKQKFFYTLMMTTIQNEEVV